MTDLKALPIGTTLRITSTEGEHFFPIGKTVYVTHPDDDYDTEPGEYLATINDPHQHNGWSEGVTAFVGVAGDFVNAVVVEDDLVESVAAILGLAHAEVDEMLAELDRGGFYIGRVSA